MNAAPQADDESLPVGNHPIYIEAPDRKKTQKEAKQSITNIYIYIYICIYIYRERERQRNIKTNTKEIEAPDRSWALRSGDLTVLADMVTMMIIMMIIIIIIMMFIMMILIINVNIIIIIVLMITMIMVPMIIGPDGHRGGPGSAPAKRVLGPMGA